MQESSLRHVRESRACENTNQLMQGPISGPIRSGHQTPEIGNVEAQRPAKGHRFALLASSATLRLCVRGFLLAQGSFPSLAQLLIVAATLESA